MKRPLMSRSAGVSLTDLLAVVVLIPLVSVVIAGCARRTYEGSGRVKCAANLKSIGQALMLYANENRGEFPRTRYEPGEKVIPTWGTGAATTKPFKPGGPDANDVTAAIFLLLTTQESTPEVYVCPSSDSEKWDFGGGGNTAQNWSNWEGEQGLRKHLSYSMHNPYPDNAAVAKGAKWNQSLGADFAIFADINPGTKNLSEHVLNLRPDASPSSRRRGNSVNHEQEGQNILYGDGHVSFEVTSFAGPNGDNIYARRADEKGPASSEIRTSQFDGNDSVLLPTDD